MKNPSCLLMERANSLLTPPCGALPAGTAYPFSGTRHVTSRALHLSSDGDVQIIDFRTPGGTEKGDSCSSLTIPRAGHATTESNFSLFVGRFTARSWSLYTKKSSLWPSLRSSRAISAFQSSDCKGCRIQRDTSRTFARFSHDTAEMNINHEGWEQALSPVKGRLTGLQKLVKTIPLAVWHPNYCQS